MLITEKFIRSLVEKDGKRTTDGGTWYPEVCHLLRLKHRLHSSL